MTEQPDLFSGIALREPTVADVLELDHVTSDQQRWIDKVYVEPHGCWLWQASTDIGGYGIFWHDDTMKKAHRWGWEQFIGPIPDDRPHLLHSCHTPACVNPRHLRPGTNAENMRDRNEAGRAARLRGESNGMAKLTDEQAAAIRKRREAGETLASIAADFGVTYQTVWRIGQGLRRSAESGKQARDEAVARAEANAHAEWLAEALIAVHHAAASGLPFTTDDLWDRLEAAGAVTHEPRAMGAVVKRAVSDGLIRPTGRYVTSTRPANHARPVREWVANG